MLAPNTLIQDRYLVVRLIGRGGMGAVYEAIDQRLKSTVALKQTISPGESIARALEREAHILAGLRHPALPKVIDHFSVEAGQFLVMEFIAGADLAALLVERGSAFEVSTVLPWAVQLLRALEYLHRQQPPILHRDIKPQNLKLSEDSEIVLLDFGLAKGLSSGQSQITASGSVYGYTPQYAPLEQIHNSGTDPRSDLYALAATIYHLLTNTRPVDAPTRATAVLRRQPDPLVALHEANPNVPAMVSNVFMQSLALNPDDRPPTAAVMRAAIEHAWHNPGPTDPNALTMVAGWVPSFKPSELPEGRTVLLGENHQPDAAAMADPPEPQKSSEPQPVVSEPSTRNPQPAMAGPQTPVQQAQTWLHSIDARWLWLALGMMVVFLVLVSTRALANRAPVVAAPATVRPATQTARPAPTRTVIRPTTPPATARPAATPTPVKPAVIKINAIGIAPTEAFSGTLPIKLTVNGTNLDKVREARLAPSSGKAIQMKVTPAGPEKLMLQINALPEPLNGEIRYTLLLDGVIQRNAVITLRDYIDRRRTSGVKAQYSYTNRVKTDTIGTYTTLWASPDPDGSQSGVLRNNDEIEVLRNNVNGWYLVRIHASDVAVHVGRVGWIERWLIDDQNVPPPPVVFAARIGQTPTDSAVKCGTNFESSVYGSVEDSSGRGISGATIRVISADGKNVFTTTTARNGTYTIGGLGCTRWIIRLVRVPASIAPDGIDTVQATVRNLNGGKWTAAEVRFRQQKP